MFVIGEDDNDPVFCVLDLLSPPLQRAAEEPTGKHCCRERADPPPLEEQKDAADKTGHQEVVRISDPTSGSRA